MYPYMHLYIGIYQDIYRHIFAQEHIYTCMLYLCLFFISGFKTWKFQNEVKVENPTAKKRKSEWTAALSKMEGNTELVKDTMDPK